MRFLQILSFVFAVISPSVCQPFGHAYITLDAAVGDTSFLESTLAEHGLRQMLYLFAIVAAFLSFEMIVIAGGWMQSKMASVYSRQLNHLSLLIDVQYA